MTERVTNLGVFLSDGEHDAHKGESAQIVADLALEEIRQNTLGGAVRVALLIHAQKQAHPAVQHAVFHHHQIRNLLPRCMTRTVSPTIIFAHSTESTTLY